MSLQDTQTTTPTTDQEPRIIGFESKPLPKSASPLELKTWFLLGAGVLFFGFFLLNDFNRETLSPAKLQKEKYVSPHKDKPSQSIEDVQEFVRKQQEEMQSQLEGIGF